MTNKFSNPILSICLATYNQPDKVKRFFESLIPQLSGEISGKVEIVVRDDSTSSETREIIKDYSKKISSELRYFQGKKEGLNVAIIFMTQEAKGDFVWWFGDDFLDSGAVNYIVKLIENNKDLSLIFVNSKGIDEAASILNMGDKDKFLRDKNQLLEEAADNLGYITATLFKREESLPFIEPSKKYIGTAWVNLFIILSVIANGKKFYFVGNPYISGDSKPPDKPWWYDSFVVFAINFWHVVDDVKSGFDKRSVWRLLNNNAWRIGKGILVYRIKGYKFGFGSEKATAKAMFPFYWKYPKFWLAAPFLIMPTTFIKYFYRTYKRLRGIF